MQIWRVMISRTSEFSAYPVPDSFVGAAIQAVMRAQHLPTDMTLFRPAPGIPSARCERAVRTSHLYIGILGHRYGGSFSDYPDVSCTEFEYDVAGELNKPRLMFLLDPTAPVPYELFGDPDNGARQQEFREKVLRESYCQLFSTPEQLAHLVTQGLHELADDGRMPGVTVPYLVPRHEDAVTERPSLSNVLESRLLDAGHEPVALTGMGGIGKTTLAMMVCARDRVRERYPGGILWLDLAPDRIGAQLADLIGDLCFQVTNERPQLTDPQQAAGYLRQRLASREDMLIVADGVDSTDQLRPLLTLADGHRLLVTARETRVLPADVVPLQVSAMEPTEARGMLESVLPGVSGPTLAELQAHGYGSPFLLSIVRSQILRRARVEGQSAGSQQRAAEELARSLSRRGPGTQLGPIVDTSLDTVDPSVRELFPELAVFPRDVDIPLSALSLLWNPDGDPSRPSIEDLCWQLAECSLVERYDHRNQTIRLHAVVTEHLRERVQDRLVALNERLLEAAAVPLASPGEPIPWWNLAPGEDYLWRYLMTHLRDAGRREEAERLGENLSWVEAKLTWLGPGAVESDLARLHTPVTSAIRRVLTQSEHLLTPTVPEYAVLDTLRSRLATVDALKQRVANHSLDGGRAHLVNAWPPPDRPNPALQRELRGHEGVVYGCATGTAPHRLVSCGGDGTVRLWDVATGAVIAVMERHSAPVRCCAVGQDGSWIAAGCDDGTVRLWYPDAEEAPTLVTGRGAQVRTCATAGPFLATGDDAGRIRRWEVRRGRQPIEMPALPEQPVGGEPVHWCAFTAAGDRLAAGYGDGHIRIWQLDSAAKPDVFPPPRRGIGSRTLVGAANCGAISADGAWLICGYRDGTLRRWDLATGTDTTLVHADDEVYACGIAPDGSWVVAADRGGNVWLWDKQDGEVRVTLRGHSDWVHACAVGADGTWFASAGRDGVIRIWDSDHHAAPAVLEGHEGEVNGCAMAPDGFWLASAGQDGAIRLWDAGTRDISGLLQEHRGGVNGCAITADSLRMVSVGQDGAALLWDLEAGEVIRRSGGHGPLSACAITREARWVVTGAVDGAVRVWDPVNDDNDTLDGHTGPVNACPISADGHLLAVTGADNLLRLWNLDERRLERTFEAHTRLTGGCTIAPDGRWFAAGGQDGTVLIWDRRSGEAAGRLFGHERSVTACAASPDSTRLVTVSVDGTIRVWSSSDGSQDALMRTGGTLRGVAWSPRGNRICAVGEHGVYLFRFLPPA
jgi:WD40 repeat protein